MKTYTQDQIYRYVSDTEAGYTKERLPLLFYSAFDVQKLLLKISEDNSKAVLDQIAWMNLSENASEGDVK